MSESTETSTPPRSDLNLSPAKTSRGLLYGIGAIVAIGLLASVFLLRKSQTTDVPVETGAPVAATATTAESTANTTNTAATATTASTAPDLTVDPATGLSKAVTTITTPKGAIKFRFYSKDAPKTVERIVALVQSGFYNGLTFHRVEPGFVIQGGDPNGNGTGGSGQKLKAEFNTRKHLAGTVAMARAQDPDSADSQFYIALDALPMLDEKYTVIGQVSEGMDVVRAIAVGDKMTSVTVQ
jgi:cyclophilin family peptidyl-prolyl cis-trans isomerase